MTRRVANGVQFIIYIDCLPYQLPELIGRKCLMMVREFGYRQYLPSAEANGTSR